MCVWHVLSHSIKVRPKARLRHQARQNELYQSAAGPNPGSKIKIFRNDDNAIVIRPGWLDLPQQPF